MRRRPDPFAAVTAQMHEWFKAEPWRTSRKLFERLQAERLDVYLDGQLRTLQRRSKGRRREVARTPVFGATEAGDGVQADAATEAEV